MSQVRLTCITYKILHNLCHQKFLLRGCLGQISKILNSPRSLKRKFQKDHASNQSNSPDFSRRESTLLGMIYLCAHLYSVCAHAHTHTHNTPTYQKEHIHLAGTLVSQGTMCAFISKIRYNISYILTFHLITHLFSAFESSSHIY